MTAMRLDYSGTDRPVPRCERGAAWGASVISLASIEAMPFTECAQKRRLCVEGFTAAAAAFALWIAKFKAGARHRFDVVDLGAFEVAEA